VIKEKAARGKVRFGGEQMIKPTKKSCGRILHTLHGVEFWWCAGLPRRRSCMWPTWKHRMPLSGHTIPVRRLPPIIWEVAILFIYLFIYLVTFLQVMEKIYCTSFFFPQVVFRIVIIHCLFFCFKNIFKKI
jgi:hypothetical protein